MVKIEIETQELMKQLDLRALVKEIIRGECKEILKELKTIVHRDMYAELREGARRVVEEKTAELLSIIMTTPYEPVTAWGEKQKPTTLRDTLVEYIRKQYDMDSQGRLSTEFAKALRPIINEATEKVQEEIKATVTTQIRQYAEIESDQIKMFMQQLIEKI